MASAAVSVLAATAIKIENSTNVQYICIIYLHRCSFHKNSDMTVKTYLHCAAPPDHAEHLQDPQLQHLITLNETKSAAASFICLTIFYTFSCTIYKMSSHLKGVCHEPSLPFILFYLCRTHKLWCLQNHLPSFRLKYSHSLLFSAEK